MPNDRMKSIDQGMSSEMTLHSRVSRRGCDASRHLDLVKKVEKFDDTRFQPELRGGQQLEMLDHPSEVLVDGEICSHSLVEQYSAPDPWHPYRALNNRHRKVVPSSRRRRQKCCLIECLCIENKPVHVEDHGRGHMG